jgi:hypothetical protein
MVVFDYQSPTDFKFAGAYVASNMWLIGRRDASGWITDVSLSESIAPGTDYNLQVVLEGQQVRLLVDGAEKLVRQYTDSLTDGDVGVGTRDALAYFDNVQVQAYGQQAQSVAGLDGGAGTSAEGNLVAFLRWQFDRAFAQFGAPEDGATEIVESTADALAPTLPPMQDAASPPRASASSRTRVEDRWETHPVDRAMAEFDFELLSAGSED